MPSPDSTRVEQSDRPKGRTLMVCNIPPWCPANHVKVLFTKFGQIERVDVQLKPGKAENIDQSELENKFKVSFLLCQSDILGFSKTVDQTLDQEFKYFIQILVLGKNL